MAPAAPIAMPTSASASAGASLTPSPTMTTGAAPAVAERANDVELLLGRLLGVDAIDAELPPDLLGDGAPIAGHDGDVPDRRPTAGARRARGRPRAASLPSRPRRRAGRPRRRGSLPCPGHRSRRARARPPRRRSSRARATTPSCRRRRSGHRHAPRSPARVPPRPAPARRARSRASCAACTSASASTCADSWSTRRRDAAARRGRIPSNATTRSSAGCPSVSVPVLSNSTVRALPSCSITPPPLTITPLRAARESPGDERDRRGQDQRTRRGDDHHRHAAHRIPGRRPGEPGDRRASSGRKKAA